MNAADELTFHAMMNDPEREDGRHRAALFLVEKRGQTEGHDMLVKMWRDTQEKPGEQIILTVQVLNGVVNQRGQDGAEDPLLQVHSMLMWWADYQEAVREGWPLTLSEYETRDGKEGE